MWVYRLQLVNKVIQILNEDFQEKIVIFMSHAESVALSSPIDMRSMHNHVM